MENRSIGWGTATPESPIHPYHYRVDSYYYVYGEDRKNTVRITHLDSVTIKDVEGTHTFYDYPEIGVIDVSTTVDEIQLWRIHIDVMNHLLWCKICTNDKLCYVLTDGFPWRVSE